MPAPPAVVLIKQYMFDQCSRSAAVVTCSLSGPSAIQSHDFAFSSFTSCVCSFCRYHVSLWYRSSMFFGVLFQRTCCDDHAPLRCSWEPSLRPIVFPSRLSFLKTNTPVVSKLEQFVTFLRTCFLTSSLEVHVHICNMCVPELRSCNTTCTVLCL